MDGSISFVAGSESGFVCAPKYDARFPLYAYYIDKQIGEHEVRFYISKSKRVIVYIELWASEKYMLMI